MACLVADQKVIGLRSILAELPGGFLPSPDTSHCNSPCFIAPVNLDNCHAELIYFKRNGPVCLSPGNKPESVMQMKKNERLQLAENELCFHKNLREKLKKRLHRGHLSTRQSDLLCLSRKEGGVA